MPERSPHEATVPPLSPDRIAAAHGVIDPAFRDSPQFEAESLGEALGCRVIVKIETANPIRCFKARGAQYFLSQLGRRAPLVCASAGNFGQGMAFAARQHGVPLTVFAATDANAFKIARMRALGATVRQCGETSDEVHAAAAAHATAANALLVVDGREPAIAEGAGTIGLELLRWPSPLDAIALPLGDGGLLGGVGCWVKAKSPTTRLVGVCAAGSPAMHLSWRAGRPVSADCDTIADALAVQTPHGESLTRLLRLADEILRVEDTALVSAMRLAHRELGVVLEPAGAAGLAALLAYRAQFEGLRVAVALTGGNITDEQMQRWLGA